MSARVAPLLPPTRLPDPATHAALAELLQLGLAVARVASHLAEVEDRAVGALAEAAAETTRATLAPSHSLADALQAGRNADSMDAARDAIAARVASITESFEKAARAVRRTAALQARLAEARPFCLPPPHDHQGANHQDANRPATTPSRRPANDAERTERPDTPECGDELGKETDEQVLASIRRDLSAATPLPILPPAPQPAPDQPPGLRTLPPPPGAPNPPPKPDT